MRLHWIPIVLALVLLATMFVSYVISVSLSHVQPFLPYISDAGVLMPERSVFSELTNLAAFLLMVMVYVRYEQVKTVKNYVVKRSLPTWNFRALWIGFLCAFGLTLIANFQLEEEKKVQSVDSSVNMSELLSQSPPPNYSTLIQNIHWAGAFLSFVFGVMWMLVQTLITRRVDKQRICRFCTRLTIALACLLVTFTGIGLAIGAATYPDDSGGFVWNDANHTWENWRGQLSMSAAACEWVSAFLIISFMLSFVNEFKDFSLIRATVVPRNNRRQQQQQQQQQRHEQQQQEPEQDVFVALYPSITPSTSEES